MLAIVNALVPVFLIIALGWGIRRASFPDAEMWPQLERLTYFILFPSLLLHTLATAQLDKLDVAPMAMALGGGLFSMVAILLALRPVLTVSGPAYSSVFQGAARWNSFVALAAVGLLYDQEGIFLAAIAIAVLVPTVNVLSVLVLTRFGGQEPAGLLTIARLLTRNPLIIACALGIALNATGLRLPGPLEPTVDVLGRAALTLGLLAVGAGLDVRNLASRAPIVGLTTLLKLLVMPCLMAIWCWVFGVEGVARVVVILCGAVPGATSSYILARQLGGDATLMASLITGSTLAAFATMPLVLYLLG